MHVRKKGINAVVDERSAKTRGKNRKKSCGREMVPFWIVISGVEGSLHHQQTESVDNLSSMFSSHDHAHSSILCEVTIARAGRVPFHDTSKDLRTSWESIESDEPGPTERTLRFRKTHRADASQGMSNGVDLKTQHKECMPRKDNRVCHETHSCRRSGRSRGVSRRTISEKGRVAKAERRAKKSSARRLPRFIYQYTIAR